MNRFVFVLLHPFHQALFDVLKMADTVLQQRGAKHSNVSTDQQQLYDVFGAMKATSRGQAASNATIKDTDPGQRKPQRRWSVCPVKNKAETRLRAINLVEQPPLRVPERENWDFFLTIPELECRNIKVGSIRQQQIQEPLFEFSGRIQGSLPALPELCT